MTFRLSLMIAALVPTAACDKREDTFEAASEVTNSAGAAESGQGRAVEAGRGLIGKAAPAAVLRTIDGEVIDLAASYGKKPVYLKFWATWCVPCREQMPSFQAKFQKYRDRILTVAVNTGFNDDFEAVRDYRQRHGLTMPISIDDGSLAAAFNLRVTPQHVVIGRSGRVLFVGHEEDDRLRKALEEALSEPAVPGAAATLDQDRPYRTGDAAKPQDAALETAAGFPITGPARDGKSRVLLFFSPWCESYLKESRPDQADACRRVREAVNRLAGPGGPHLVGISSGLWSSAKDVDEYRSTGQLRIPIYLDADGALFRSFEVQEVPTLIIIDKQGRISRRVGPNDKNLNVAIRTAMAGS